MDDVVYNNLKEFSKGKKDTDDIFERINVIIIFNNIIYTNWIKNANLIIL